MTFDPADLQQTIQKNCDISDANYAGLFSLCGLLLRMRDLYKWQHDLPPWEEPEPSRVLAWVDEREQHWEEISHLDLQPIVLGGRVFDPFDMVGVNAVLRPFGLVYGAGYVLGMKPSFFLGEVAETRRFGALTVDFVDRELARDIYMTPAMRQGNQVFARRTPMLFHLWDQILEMRPSARQALSYALAQYRLDPEDMRNSPGTLGPQLHRVAHQEMETWVHHEVGEALEDGFVGQLWHEIVATHCGSPVEIFARVIKDLLADTHPHGLLGHIITNRIRSSLAFYVCFMRPFSRMVYPEMQDAFRLFPDNEDWSAIETARNVGYAKVQAYAGRLIEIHEEGRRRGEAWSRNQIISTLLEPLGISGLAETEMEDR